MKKRVKLAWHLVFVAVDGSEPKGLRTARRNADLVHLEMEKQSFKTGSLYFKH
jgi:hypothetical protein